MKANLIRSAVAAVLLVAPGAAVAQSVQLVKAYTMSAYRAGGGGYVRKFMVRTDNSGDANAQVFIHHSQADGGAWVDYPAELVYADPERKIWKLELSASSGAVFEGGDAFVVKYVTGGAAYWDNNGGQNYSMGGVGGPMLGNGVNIALSSATLSGPVLPSGQATFTLDVAVRNIAYDNWTTNPFNVEEWSAQVTLDACPTTLEFAIAYSVNGATYWDNNQAMDHTIYQHALLSADWVF